jgi:RHS repeat-associated protein
MKKAQSIVSFLIGFTLTGVFSIQRCSAQANIPGGGNTVPAPTVTSPPDKPGAYITGAVYNYLRTWTPKQPYTNMSDLTSNTATVGQVGMTTIYSDGFGRPVQTVAWQASPTGADLVSPRVYDPFGREQDKFLLYQSPSADGSFKKDPFGEQAAFYGTAYPSEQPAFQNEKFYYSSTQFEPSPLNRVTGGYEAGNSWIGSAKGGQTSYLVNNQTDNVQLWNITSNALSYSNNDVTTNIPITTTTYGIGQLAKKLTIDVNGYETIEFLDKDGLTVMKKTQIGAITNDATYPNWLCTYYIYDDLGRQRFIIPPKAVAAMGVAGSWNLTADMINELCFRYEFDDRDRVIAKKEPGAGWEYLVYDQKDRPVFTQDANMRLKNQWMGTLYDNQDRVVETGILTYSSGPLSLQAYVTGNTGNIGLAGQAITGSYTSSSLPIDLPVPVPRQIGLTQYLATNSITFSTGFISEDGAIFVAEIVTGGNSSVPTTVGVVNDNPLPPGADFIPLTMSYYDTYTTGKSYNTSNNGLLSLGVNVTADPLPSAATTFTTGLKTSSKIRVIENANDLTQGMWLETASFYDDKGRIIQQQSDNYKGGVDYKTTRYDFTSKEVCSYLVHNNPSATPATTIGIRTNTDYDPNGRVVEIRKTINENTAQTRIIEFNQYDALGKLKRKKFGQKTDGNGNPIPISDLAGDNTDWLEVNDYAYDIQGWLKGVNWDYASAPTSSQVDYQNNKWFGLDLSYDWGFSYNQFNGSPAGLRWVSAGDGKERAYGYKYDPTNRLLSADFRQNFGSGTSPNWQTADPGSSFRIDYSVKLGDGITPASAYDANGNILQMQQMGLVLNTSQSIDNLSYSYENNQIGNKLRAVTDNSGSTAALGDFTDNNTTADDYGYDVNGNLTTDLNKRLAGTTGVDQASGGAIVYTFQNLPWLLNVKNADQSSRGTITFIYDATGKRLEKRVNELASAANNNTASNTITSYLGSFVYSNNVLQYFTHEDGKIRPTLNSVQPYVYDYLIKDHLLNTRVVLTDEHEQVNFPVATVEETPASSLTTEQGNFSMNTQDITLMSNVPLFSGAAGSGYSNNNGNPPYNLNPNSLTSAQSQYMYKLNGQIGDKTGLGITIKVMTGDQVQIWGKSYYHVDKPIDNTSYSIVATALNTFIAAFAGTPVMAAGPHGATAIALQSSPVTPPALSNYLTNKIPVPTSGPKAYINWILFDEQFRPVCTGTNSGFLFAGATPDAVEDLAGTAMITTSGYLYVYCSNESNLDVYFDNLQVMQNRGPLLEETHYYPFGLTMAGISSKALKMNYKENKYKLSGQLFDDDMGLNTYQMQHRTMDPQIGRFQQIDPAADKYCYNSTYAYAEDKVTMGIDLEGLELLPMNTSWFRLNASAAPNYFGLTWTQSVQIVNDNFPAVFRGPDGRPLSYLPAFPAWPWDQNGVDPDPTPSTSGRKLVPNMEEAEAFTTQAQAVGNAPKELNSWAELFNKDISIWSGYHDQYDNSRMLTRAIDMEGYYDNSIAKTYPFQYTPVVKDNITNFLLDGSFPSSPDILNSSYKTDLETNLMTGYYGFEILSKENPDLIQKETLDSYNLQLGLYNLMPGDHYNFLLGFLKNNGGYMPLTTPADMWIDPDPGIDNNGEIQFVTGEGSDGGGDQ